MRSTKSVPSMEHRERVKTGPSSNKKLSPLAPVLPPKSQTSPTFTDSSSSMIGGDDMMGSDLHGGVSNAPSAIFLSGPHRQQMVQNPKLALIQAAYHRARTKFEEYQLSPPLALLSRTNSEKASRIYYAMFTLMQASISASQTTKIEKYIRSKASTFAKSTFDMKEWNEVIKIARECRTHELEEARNEVRLQEKKLGMQLVSSSAILKTICAECGEFKRVVGQDISNLQGFMQKMKSVILSTITLFAAKQAGIVAQWETSYASVAQDLALETERSGLLEEQVSTLLDMIERIKQEKLSKASQIEELSTTEIAMKKRIEELEATIEENNKKALKAAREATIKMNNLELHLSNKESECEELTSDLQAANEKIETLNTRMGTSRRSMDEKLESVNDTIRQLRVTISNLQNEAQAQELAKSNTVNELTETRESLKESRMTIAASESLIEAALKKQKEGFDLEVVKAAKTAKLYAKMAEDEHKLAIDSLSQQLEVAQTTATRLTGMLTYILSSTSIIHSSIHCLKRSLIHLLTHIQHIFCLVDVEWQYQSLRTEHTLLEKERNIMRKQLSHAQEQGFVLLEPEDEEPVVMVVNVVQPIPVDVPVVVQESSSSSVQPTVLTPPEMPSTTVTPPADQPDPPSNTANEAANGEIVLSDGEEMSLPDDVSDLGR